MGTIKTFICNKCGNTVDLNEGIGKMWNDLYFSAEMFYPQKEDDLSLNFYDELDEKMISEIHQFIETSKAVKVTKAYYQPYICKKCGKTESKLYFKIESDKKTYRPNYYCECGNRYRRLTLKEQEHPHCNKCGAEMTESQYICWD